MYANSRSHVKSPHMGVPSRTGTPTPAYKPRLSKAYGSG